MAGSDSAVSDLVVTASRDAPEAGDKQVVDVVLRFYSLLDMLLNLLWITPHRGMEGLSSPPVNLFKVDFVQIRKMKLLA